MDNCAKKARVAVLVSDGGTNLQAIIDEQAKGTLPHVELCAVISNKAGAYALERAEKAGIPGLVITRENGAADFEEKLISALEEREIDLIVLAGFMCILSENFTSRYPERIINVHPALIPSFCGKGFYGLHVHEAALEYGVKVTGATVHFVNEIPDGGRIIMQKAVEIKEGDTPEVLQKRVMQEAEWKILPAALEKVAASLTE
ncbi:MAG: phosphoribosylglycinamide formyltransferase [Clostridia bacterium]|nr:phosphoribosylglycinamide formyltransferase [Clostridia bacterium]